MKRTAIILFILLNCKVQAQYITTLITGATPPATLTQWAGKKEVLGYLVVAQGGSGQPPKPVLIKTEIKTSGGTLVATTDLARARQYTFRIGTTMLDAADVLPLENMIFSGQYKTALTRTGKLLSDNYEICVQLVDPQNYAPVSEVKCRSFFIASLQLPALMKPYNEETLPAELAQTAILFRWSPPAPKPQTIVKYRLQVFEVMPAQNPVQAMRSNFPVLDKELTAITQYTWQPQGIINWSMGLDSLLKPAQFVWTVQTTDAAGIPLGDGNVNGDGRSEPQTFFINPPATRLKEEVKKLQKKE